MNESDITPEWARWASMAASQVIQHMNGAPLVPVSYAFAAQSVKRSEAKIAHVGRRRHRSAEWITGLHRRQVSAALELELSDRAIARNLKITVEQVAEIKKAIIAEGK